MTPDFIIAGFPKCGTTSIFHYLNQHPDICVSSYKEPHYYSKLNPTYTGYKENVSCFGKYHIYTQSDYDNLYSHCDINSIKGEASTNTVYFDSFYPKDTKLIIGLRNPITRAYSHYLQMRRLKREVRSFKKAILLEDKRIEQGYSPAWHYTKLGFYSEHFHKIKHLKKYFYFFEDFETHSNEILDEISDFLGASKFDFDTSKVYNPKTKEPLNPFLFRYLPGRFQYKYRIEPPEMSYEDKTYLQKLYKLEILKIEQEFGRVPISWK